MRVNKLFEHQQRIKNDDTELETALADLDTVLFAKIHSQTSDGDKRALLAIQNYMRIRRSAYVYLEIGSYYGGSLQPHIIDPKCSRIYSIDKRPGISPDNRFPEGHVYEDEVKIQMIKNLKELGGNMEKLIIFDNDAAEIDPALISEKPDLCFIDAEHTDVAVESDFNFCRKVLNKDGIILFHDAFVVRDGIRRIMNRLKVGGVNIQGYHLNSSIYAIVFGEHPLLEAYFSTHGLQRQLMPLERITWVLPNWIRRLWKR